MGGNIFRFLLRLRWWGKKQKQQMSLIKYLQIKKKRK
jgi:hypothetical protein